MRKAIVCVGVDKWHPQGVDRLVQSLHDVNYDGELLTFKEYPEGSPTHTTIPYAFKAFALQRAKELNIDLSLWVDASFWANKNPQPLFNHIEHEGYLVVRNGFTTGQWSTDRQLEKFGYTREESFSIPHAVGGIIGINNNHPIGQNLLKQYYDNHTLFCGSWTNHHHEVSTDPRVLGSRHDQTILSLIAHKEQLTFTPPQGIMDYNCQDDSIWYLRGM